MICTVQQSALDRWEKEWLKLTRLPTDVQKQIFHLWCHLKTRNEMIQSTGKNTIQIRFMLHDVCCHRTVAKTRVKVR